MKVKALKSFYVQRLKLVVTVGQEFETNKSHGDELIAKGMAVFVADSDVSGEIRLSDHEQELIEKHTQELQEEVSIKLGEVVTLTNSITEKDAQITILTTENTDLASQVSALETQVLEKDELITELQAQKDKPAEKTKKG